VQLTRENGALSVAYLDHFRGQRAHSRPIGHETVEQDVEHGADSEHFLIRHCRPFDARAEIALPDTLGHRLEIADRPQRDHNQSDVQAECDNNGAIDRQ
jgi:hypothetical protein